MQRKQEKKMSGKKKLFELKKTIPSWRKKATSRAEPSWKSLSSSYGSSQLGSGSSLLTMYIGLISLKATCKNNGYKTKSRDFFLAFPPNRKYICNSVQSTFEGLYAKVHDGVLTKFRVWVLFSKIWDKICYQTDCFATSYWSALQILQLHRDTLTLVSNLTLFLSLIFQKFGTHNHTESFIMTKEQLQSFFI